MHNQGRPRDRRRRARNERIRIDDKHRNIGDDYIVVAPSACRMADRNIFVITVVVVHSGNGERLRFKPVGLGEFQYPW